MVEAFDYVHYHVDQAARRLHDARGKRVLVVGCNRGREVSLFLDAGAREVWGIDVMDEVGIDFPLQRARYLQMSGEAMDLEDRMFDVAFCVATMEHIARPEAAFSEINRVTADEGFVYVVSAPLWHSRQGHHRSNLFDLDRYPWIHLRFDAETLKRMCEAGEIDYPASVEDAAAEIDYMMSSKYFNKRPARDYVHACSGLKGLVIERNALDLEPEAVLGLLSSEDRAELIGRVGDAIELRALTHMLVGWKTRRPRGDRLARAHRRLGQRFSKERGLHDRDPAQQATRARWLLRSPRREGLPEAVEPVTSRSVN
jgi:SAM-dependent methyltransferase